MNKHRIMRTIASLLVILVALSTSAGGGGVRWKTIRVDGGRTFHVSNSSLKLDDPGVPSVAYGGDHLYYATLIEDEFVTSTVDNNWGVGKYASLVIDPSSGYPRISYYDETNQHLKYAEMVADDLWTITTVDYTYSGNKTGIVLDNITNLPHIAYTRLDGQVWHAWKTCAVCTWQKEVVDASVIAAGSNISLAVDGINHLHLAYYDSTTQALHYAFYNGTTWSTQQPADPYGYSHFGLEPSLAIDGNNRPAIVYKTDSSINYARKTNDTMPGTWTFAIVYTGSTNNTDLTAPSLQLPNDDPDQPWISFIDGDGSVMLAIFDDMGSYTACNGTDGDFGCRPIDENSTFRGSTSLVVEVTITEGNINRVVYIDKQTGELRYRFEASQEVWGDFPVDFSTNAGLSSSLVVDSDGPHIAYFDRDATIFKYAEIDDTAPDGCGEYGLNAWFKCQGFDNAVVGSNVSVANGGNDGASHVAYYDRDHPGALRFGTLNPLWSSIVIDDSSADIGRYASIALNPASNRMAIAYMDVTNGRLKYAEELSTGTGDCGPSDFWDCGYIDDIGPGGSGISLTFGYNHTPLISYLDGDDQLVKVARFVGSGSGLNCARTNDWDCRAIAPGYFTDRGQTSIWADIGTSLVMVSWYQYNVSASNLMWSQYTLGSGWLTPERVADAMYSGEQNSLTTIGIMPVIAYTDGRFNRNALNYAWRIGVGGDCDSIEKWSCEVLDSSGITGFYPSIKNNSGRLYISYYDWTNGDLMLTFQAFPTFAPLIKKP